MILDWLRPKASAPKAVPTVVHITHVKAGSTWIDRILRQLFGDLVAPRGKLAAAEVDGDLSKFTFPPERIYSAMFITREQFLAHPELHDARRFVVIRDLRDTLISLYFSLKVSHPLDERGNVAQQRAQLESLSQEEGILHLIREQLRATANLQLSWLGHGELLLKYENLLTNDVSLLSELFLDRLELPISRRHLQKVVRANRFEARFKRPLGTEDASSHGRQGAPGNWRRNFTPAIASAFREDFGDVLVATGYEADGTWADTLVSG